MRTPVERSLKIIGMAAILEQIIFLARAIVGTLIASSLEAV